MHKLTKFGLLTILGVLLILLRVFEEHHGLCIFQSAERLVPSDREYEEFNHMDRMIELPCLAYCDFESMLIPVSPFFYCPL